MRRKPVAALIWFTACCLVVGIAGPVLAGSRHDRREQRLAESQNQNASAEEIQKAREVSLPVTFDEAFEIVVQVLKSKGLTIESGNRDIGQIKTEFQITIPKKPKQHGMRYLIDLRRVSDKETELKIVALEQIRIKRLQAEPWKAPFYNSEASERLTSDILKVVEGGERRHK